jgi:hypothetical protein
MPRVSLHAPCLIFHVAVTSMQISRRLLAILLSRANPIIQSSIKIGAGCPFPNTPRIATMADHE